MVEKLKLNDIIGLLSEDLQNSHVVKTIVDARGFLVQSDPRMDFLLKRTEKSEYHHSAMPLLDITFRDTNMFRLDLDMESKEVQTGRFILNQDSIWLLERKNALPDAIRLPLRAIRKLTIEIPRYDNLQKGRISDFLDSI